MAGEEEGPAQTNNSIGEEGEVDLAGLGVFSNQIAGHKDSQPTLTPSFFTAGNGRLYKNISYDVRGEREEGFYKMVFSDETLSEFRRFIPTYYKSTLFRGVRYLCLSDICHGMEVACAADVKVGTVDYYSLDSPQKKKIHMKKKLGIAPILGFRFAGAKVYKEKAKETISYDKKWGLQFTTENAALMTEQYLDNGTEIRRDVLPHLISQISDLRDYYTRQTRFWLCRSSLLIVYDGLRKDFVTLRMIDFSHNVSQDIASDNTGVDIGLGNLLDIFGHIERGTTADWRMK